MCYLLYLKSLCSLCVCVGACMDLCFTAHYSSTAPNVGVSWWVHQRVRQPLLFPDWNNYSPCVTLTVLMPLGNTCMFKMTVTRCGLVACIHTHTVPKSLSWLSIYWSNLSCPLYAPAYWTISLVLVLVWSGPMHCFDIHLIWERCVNSWLWIRQLFLLSTSHGLMELIIVSHADRPLSLWFSQWFLQRENQENGAYLEETESEN